MNSYIRKSILSALSVLYGVSIASIYSQVVNHQLVQQSKNFLQLQLLSVMDPSCVHESTKISIMPLFLMRMMNRALVTNLQTSSSPNHTERMSTNVDPIKLDEQSNVTSAEDRPRSKPSDEILLPLWGPAFFAVAKKRLQGL